MAKGPALRKKGPPRRDSDPILPKAPEATKRAASIVPSETGRAAAIPPSLPVLAPAPLAATANGAPPVSATVAPQLSLPQMIARWRPAPWIFARECLGFIPDAWQNVILHAVVGQDAHGQPLPKDQPYDKIALKACKGPGKTAVEAVIAWWFLLCFENPKVIATSITGENLRDNLWTEMAIWQQKSKLLTTLFEWKVERIESRERPATWYMSARTWPKDADKTKQAATLAGIHGRYTLLIVDESGGVPEGVTVAGLAHHSTTDVDGAQIQGEQVHITLQCGNPDRLDGSLGVACTRDRAKWFVYEITGDPKAPDRAPRMDIKWCQEQIDTFGPDHPWTLVNVMGKFPPQQDNKLLGPEIVRAAMNLVIDERVWRDCQRLAGFDVARSLNSDRSSLARRQGPVVFPFKVWRLDDSDQLASQVAFILAEFQPVATFVDATGIGGPVADRLRALGLNVIMVYFGNPARDRRFADKRTEIWWQMAQEIKGQSGVPGLALPNDPELIPDLTGPTMDFDAKSKIRLESKESMKKRGVKSPDLGDSLACTYAEPVFADAQPFTGEQGRVQTEYDPYAERT